MRFKDEKVGYILLTVGVVMMLISVILMITVFTGNMTPPKLFNFSDIYFPQMEGEADTTLIISGQNLSNMVAMGFWYMLMFFIMFAGGRIASLGINLIRVEVRVKEETEDEDLLEGLETEP